MTKTSLFSWGLVLTSLSLGHAALAADEVPVTSVDAITVWDGRSTKTLSAADLLKVDSRTVHRKLMKKLGSSLNVHGKQTDRDGTHNGTGFVYEGTDPNGKACEIKVITQSTSMIGRIANAGFLNIFLQADHLAVIYNHHQPDGAFFHIASDSRHNLSSVRTDKSSIEVSSVRRPLKKLFGTTKARPTSIKITKGEWNSRRKETDIEVGGKRCHVDLNKGTRLSIEQILALSEPSDVNQPKPAPIASESESASDGNSAH